MLYNLFEMGLAVFAPARLAADTYKVLLDNPFNPVSYTTFGRGAVAACELFERTTRRYEKPEMGIKTTLVGERTVAVTPKVVMTRPFMNLVRFDRDVSAAEAAASPKILVVAPMSGHHASLLRGTVESLLPGHDVYVTDWLDARAVPLKQGSFDLQDYVDLLIEIFQHFEGDIHVLAVCQPAVPVLAAVAHMEALGDPFVPASMTLMGGPIDTRVNPTIVNKHAKEHGLDWFRRNAVDTVPGAYAGRGRLVYPGFLQLTGFMTMNLDRHIKAHRDLFIHLVKGDGDSADKHKEFYDEYLAVMDLSAEFYLETIETVFLQHKLAVGTMQHRGEAINLSAIRNVPMLTIEGENDDITGSGQCRAAHGLLSGLSPSMKAHYEQPGVGHYGIFNGSRYRKEILPRLVEFIDSFDHRRQTVTVSSTTQPSYSSLN